MRMRTIMSATVPHRGANNREFEERMLVKYHQPFYIIVVFLLLAIYVQRGTCIIEVELTIPDPGATIAGFANSTTNVNFFCELSNGGLQHVTSWFILTAMSRELRRNPSSVRPGDSQFLLSGNIIETDILNIASNTNLTILGLTTDLNNSTLFCGTGNGILVEFTIIVYEHPSPPTNVTAMVGDSYASISWAPPISLGNPGVSFYSLVVLDESGNTLSNVTLPASGVTEFSATDLLPGTNYTIVLRAVSQISPVLVISPTTELDITTNTSVPLLTCTATSISEDQTSVSIVWDNIHSGGLDLISATIEYALLSSISNTTSANFTPVINPMVDVVEGEAILQTLPAAGLTYTFRVSTENIEGESLPSECPMIFLEIGTPSTPDTPTAEADGPVALLTLRTEEAGVGDSPHSFAFSILIYTFNSTDNTSRSDREDERFISPEYRSGESVVVHVEEVMQLGQLYQFAARAVNMFGESEVSDLSDPVLLNVSVPAISMVGPQMGEDGIIVSWLFLHTGGSTIDQVEILLRLNTDSSSFELVLGGNISRPSDDMFLISGRYLQAGLSYQVGVRATNEFGVSSLTTSETLESTVGVPAIPLVPTLFSSTASSITLNLHTVATGLVAEGEGFTFRLRITATGANGVPQTRFAEGTFPVDISGKTVQMTVSDVESGFLYVFSVRGKNQFGQSDYSADSESISIMEDDEGEETGSGGLGTRELIGIAVGVAIVMVMVLLCCILVVCAYISKGSKSHKPEVGVGSSSAELQDNSLYDRHQKNRQLEQEAWFPPDAYESQYEPPPEDQAVVLRPKPTHPTGDQDQSDRPPALYDTLHPTRRRQYTPSIGSGKELPNPLYSGILSSRPNSQLLHSGSGTVHSTDDGGNTNTPIIVGEPLYSEANMPPAEGGTVYSEPTLPAQTSEPLDSQSYSPPPPPDPKSIPTYADAGPASMSSQEHLYSELPDPRHYDKPSSNPRPHGRIPIFHLPPPPPLPYTLDSNKNPGEFSSASSLGDESAVKSDMS